MPSVRRSRDSITQCAICFNFWLDIFLLNHWYLRTGKKYKKYKKLWCFWRYAWPLFIYLGRSMSGFLKVQNIPESWHADSAIWFKSIFCRDWSSNSTFVWYQYVQVLPVSYFWRRCWQCSHQSGMFVPYIRIVILLCKYMKFGDRTNVGWFCQPYLMI